MASIVSSPPLYHHHHRHLHLNPTSPLSFSSSLISFSSRLPSPKIILLSISESLLQPPLHSPFFSLLPPSSPHSSSSFFFSSCSSSNFFLPFIVSLNHPFSPLHPHFIFFLIPHIFSSSLFFLIFLFSSILFKISLLPCSSYIFSSSSSSLFFLTLFLPSLTL